MPELSPTTLFWIDLALFLMYLPLGFMGWAFAAAPTEDRAKVRIITAVATAPALVLLLCLVLPCFLPPAPAQVLRWIPPGALAIIIGLIFLGAMITGFVRGAREPGSPSKDSDGA